jgi:integrase
VGEKNCWRSPNDHINGRDRHSGGGLALREVANQYMKYKKRKVEAGELKQASFDQEYRALKGFVDRIGVLRPVDELRPDDFAKYRATLAKRYGWRELAKHIGFVKSMFRYAEAADIIGRTPKYGPEFKGVSKKAKRAHREQTRREHGIRRYEPAEIVKLIDAAAIPLKAMVLLAANCGFGNADCAELRLDDIDLEAGTLSLYRGKTGKARRAVLWSETIDALQQAIERRPKPKLKADAGCVFITKYGRRFVRYRPGRDGKRGACIDGVGLTFGRLAKAAGIDRHGVGFYGLRRSFRTAADSHPDRPAVDLVMGHSDDPDDMRAEYVDDSDISTDRLKAVADHVHNWIFKGSA